jgi:hypothetical protein
MCSGAQRKLRTSENSVKTKFGCTPARRDYLRRDHNTSGGYYRSLMYDKLRTSDALHKKTGSPGSGWTLGPNCASKFSRSPHVASRNRSQQIHATNATGYVANWPHAPRIAPSRRLKGRPGGGACYSELPRIPLLKLSKNSLSGVSSAKNAVISQ